MDAIVKHYDALIDEANDPVYDPEPLKAYMDRWDGQNFIEEMFLTPEKSVLEIGVGTGRLAVRVAPRCGEFVGIDISPKTADRARENLREFSNAEILCLDFMDYRPDRLFDVIYSSLTFMHISDKQRAIGKVRSMLSKNGRFVLSVDKKQDGTLVCETREILLYPDRKEDISAYLTQAGLEIRKHYETEFAHIFVACRFF